MKTDPLQHDRFDVLIRGGTVIDGTGERRYRADVGTRGDTIAAIGDLSEASAAQVLDARGRIVAPGFIDVHTHDDRAVLHTPDMAAKVSQGVTTVVTGNCGISLAPLRAEPVPPLNLLGERSWFRYDTFKQYLDELEAAPASVNVAPLIGHSTLRVRHMSALDREADAGEIDAMSRALEEALQAGAIGLSSGLAYPTAIAASADEMIQLATLLSERGAIYTTHMRDEGDHIVAAVEETLSTGGAAGVPVVISHHKVCGHRNFGRIGETLAMIEEAQRTQAVAFDVYPYTASSTVLLRDFLDRAEKVLITWSEPHPECNARVLQDIAAEWGCDIETAADRLQPAGAIYFQMDEADLQRALSFPGAMIGSDGLPHDQHPHPRLWGTFPRVLGRYSRELGLFTLEQAVHAMSGRPAQVFGLRDRGTLRTGAFADVVVFDAETVVDTATFETPVKQADGIEAVFVNGQLTWHDKTSTGARSGGVLRLK